MNTIRASHIFYREIGCSLSSRIRFQQRRLSCVTQQRHLSPREKPHPVPDRYRPNCRHLLPPSTVKFTLTGAAIYKKQLCVTQQRHLSPRKEPPPMPDRYGPATCRHLPPPSTVKPTIAGAAKNASPLFRGLDHAGFCSSFSRMPSTRAVEAMAPSTSR